MKLCQAKFLMQLIGVRKRCLENNDASEGDEVKTEENSKESEDRDSFESDSELMEDKAEADNIKESSSD